MRPVLENVLSGLGKVKPKSRVPDVQYTQPDLVSLNAIESSKST